MSKIELKEYDFSSVDFLSENQLRQHYQLYKGYVQKTNEIFDLLDTDVQYPNPNTTYSPLRSLMKGQSYALDGVKLHELYFENILGESNKEANIDKSNTKIYKLIVRDFNNYENFENRFKNTGLCMRGWVVLSYDEIDKKLHIIGQDAHDEGSIWQSYPLLVMDVYEHAYMIDFGINRKKYIDLFANNINWKVVNQRLLELYNKE